MLDISALAESNLPEFGFVSIYVNIPPYQAKRFDCGNVLDKRLLTHTFNSVGNNRKGSLVYQ